MSRECPRTDDGGGAKWRPGVPYESSYFARPFPLNIRDTSKLSVLFSPMKRYSTRTERLLVRVLGTGYRTQIFAALILVPYDEHEVTDRAAKDNANKAMGMLIRGIFGCCFTRPAWKYSSATMEACRPSIAAFNGEHAMLSDASLWEAHVRECSSSMQGPVCVLDINDVNVADFCQGEFSLLEDDLNTVLPAKARLRRVALMYRL